MRLTITIGGKAGQGINKVSEIMSKIAVSYGYYTFNYRDYQSLIRGGQNFNNLSIADYPIESHESKSSILVAFDDRTIETHKKNLTKKAITLTAKKFYNEGQNLNIALAGSLTKILGIPFEELEQEVQAQLKDSEDAVEAARRGYESQNAVYTLKRLHNNLRILTGSQATAIGAKLSGLQAYIAYPMTPATGALNEIAFNQVHDGVTVFQSENEIAAINMAMGCSFAGKKTMTGTSGGGFDLMSEGLSMQGIAEIPLVVYLATRVGPGTGVPTYTAQSDLDIALRAGHGEAPRFVIAPGNPTEMIRATSEALFLSEKFRSLSVLLTDKHLAESEFSSSQNIPTPLKYEIKRKIPGKNLVKASSYEVDRYGNSTESAILTEKNVDRRLKKWENAKKYIEQNMEMIKIYGKRNSKNLIIGWGSTSGAIKDAIRDLDAKFLQVIYMKPLSPEIKKEIEKASKIILVECNVTGQLGRLIREKTGIKIGNRLLKYNGRPFRSDELRKYIEEII